MVPAHKLWTAVMDGDLEQFIFDYLKKSKA